MSRDNSETQKEYVVERRRASNAMLEAMGRHHGEAACTDATANCTDALTPAKNGASSSSGTKAKTLTTLPFGLVFMSAK